MTIVAGFRTCEGIVICGDTLETVPNLSKRHVAKVKVHPVDGAKFKFEDTGNLAACFCGAGEGPFTDMLVSNLWAHVKDCTTLDSATERAKSTIRRTYRQYGQIYQQGLCPSVELIYGLKLGTESRMFSATGPVVNEIENYCAHGAGYYMADFLASRMKPSEMDLNQCVILAAYILFQAKEHVDGCGGESQIAILRHKGKSGHIDQSRVRAITTLLEKLDVIVGDVLVAAADLRDFSVLPQEIAFLGRMATEYREKAKNELKDFDRAEALSEGGIYVDGAEFYIETDEATTGSKDEFGFIKGPTQLDPQKSEDQQ